MEHRTCFGDVAAESLSQWSENPVPSSALFSRSHWFEEPRQVTQSIKLGGLTLCPGAARTDAVFLDFDHAAPTLHSKRALTTHRPGELLGRLCIDQRYPFKNDLSTSGKCMRIAERREREGPDIPFDEGSVPPPIDDSPVRVPARVVKSHLLVLRPRRRSSTDYLRKMFLQQLSPRRLAFLVQRVTGLQHLNTYYVLKCYRPIVNAGCHVVN